MPHTPRRRRRPTKDRRTIAEQALQVAEVAAHNTILREALVTLMSQTTSKEALTTIDDALNKLEKEDPAAIVFEAARLLLRQLVKGEPGTSEHTAYTALLRIIAWHDKRTGRKA